MSRWDRETPGLYRTSPTWTLLPFTRLNSQNTFLRPILELLFFKKYWRQQHSSAQKLNKLQVNLNLNHTLCSSIYLYTYLPTLPVFPGVSKFFIRSPGLPVRAPNLPGITYRGLLQNFLLILFFFWDVKKENESRSEFSPLSWAVLDWKM